MSHRSAQCGPFIYELENAMKKTLIPFLFGSVLALGATGAFAQYAPASDNAKTEVNAPPMTEAEKSADSFCLRQTGSHLHAITKRRNESAVECANAPGRAYTQEDIQRTGATNTRDALRRLDPSIR